MAVALFCGVVLIAVSAMIFYGAPWLAFEAKFIKPLEAEITKNVRRKADLDERRSRSEWEARLFDRQLEKELNEAVEVVRASHAQIKPLKEEKSSLHNNFDGVQKDLSDWYGSATPTFSKSRKIPRESLLGLFGLEATLNQRDRLKSRRDAIGGRIQTVKSDIDDIYTQKLAPAKAARDDAYAGKIRLKKMRADGIDQAACLAAVARLTADIDTCDTDIAELQAKIVSETARFRVEQAAAKVAKKQAASDAREMKRSEKAAFKAARAKGNREAP